MFGKFHVRRRILMTGHRAETSYGQWSQVVLRPGDATRLDYEVVGQFMTPGQAQVRMYYHPLSLRVGFFRKSDLDTSCSSCLYWIGGVRRHSP